MPGAFLGTSCVEIASSGSSCSEVKVCFTWAYDQPSDTEIAKIQRKNFIGRIFSENSCGKAIKSPQIML